MRVNVEDLVSALREASLALENDGHNGLAEDLLDFARQLEQEKTE